MVALGTRYILPSKENRYKGLEICVGISDSSTACKYYYYFDNIEINSQIFLNSELRLVVSRK